MSVILDEQMVKWKLFSFVLYMKLILKVFPITNELSQLLQRKDRNIVETIIVDWCVNMTNHLEKWRLAALIWWSRNILYCKQHSITMMWMIQYQDGVNQGLMNFFFLTRIDENLNTDEHSKGILCWVLAHVSGVHVTI